MTVLVDEPVCRFYRLIDSAPEPQRANPSANGTLPVRAFTYCQAVRDASKFGYHLFAPIDFGLKFDGIQMWWTYSGAKEWLPLRGTAAPRFEERFAEAAPPAARSLIPAFLTPLLEPGVVQVFLGYLIGVSAGFALHIRGVANMPRVQPYSLHETFEGIVDSRHYLGPAFVNIQVLQTNCPVHFTTKLPICQVQPVLHECYRDPAFEVVAMDDIGEDVWGRYVATMEPKTDPNRKPGAYAVASRKDQAGAQREAEAARAIA